MAVHPMTQTGQERYKRLREIGRGGMGIVWEAEDQFGRRVALKDLNIKSGDPAEYRRRFEHEARILASLKHEAVLQLHYYWDEDKEHPFYTMQLVSGGPAGGRPSLHDRLGDKQQFSVAQSFDIARQLAGAIHYLWSMKVVHRDLKPENVLLEERDDGTFRVLIADFGLAVLRDDEPGTAPVYKAGTVKYWSPEQAEGKRADFPMDVWGFGAVMYKLLTGRTPRHKGAPDFSDRPDVPREFVILLSECLQIDPDRRPRTPDLLARLQAMRGRPSGVDAIPIIGREKELQQLERNLESSRYRARCTLVGGRRGIGKRALVNDICRRAEDNGTLVLRGVVTGDLIAPHVAFCQIIEEYFRHAPEPVHLGDLSPELVHHFPLLKDIPQLATKRKPRRTAPNDRAPFSLLADVFRRIAARQHLLVIVEDLHLGNVSVESMRTIVAQALSGLLLVATYDNEVVNKDLAKLRDHVVRDASSVYDDIELRPFTEDDDRRLLTTLLGSNQVAPETVAQTRAHCGGIPIITKLFITDARDRNHLIRDEQGEWHFRRDAVPSAQLLPDVQELIERSLSRLPARLRTLIDNASVAIDTFSLQDLVCLTGWPLARVEADLSRVVKWDLLKQVRPNRYAFALQVVRDHVHNRLKDTVRQVRHRKLGIYREQLGKSDEKVFGYLLRHFQEAGIPDKVREYGLKHAEVCLKANDPYGAIAAARAALAENDTYLTAGTAHYIIARAFRMLHAIGHCLESADDAFRRFKRGEHWPEACDVAVFAADVAWQEHLLSELDRWLDSGLPLARKLEATSALVALLRHEATARAVRGEDQKATAAVEELSVLIAETVPSDQSRSTLRIPLGLALDSIDPTKSNLRGTADVASLVFETLTRIDDYGRAVPWLAESFRPEDGYCRYTFRMRSGVTFHDGTPCTARDVKWAFERLLRRARPLHHMLPDDVIGGEAVANGVAKSTDGIQVDEHENVVSIDLSRPLPAFPLMLSDPAFCVVPYGTEEFPVDRAHGLSGTGPYYVDRFIPRKLMVLKASPRHWRPHHPRTREIVISLGLSPGVIADGFRSGAYSLAFDLTQKEHDRLRLDQEHDWHYDVRPTLSTCFAAFNMNRPGMTNQAVREALIAAMDLDAIAETVRGRAIPAYGLFPPALLEVERTRRQFESPTLPNYDLTAVCSSSLAAAFPGVVAGIISRLKNQNVKVRLLEVTAPELDRAPEADIYFGYFSCDYPDLDGFALPLLHSRAGAVGRICGSPEMDEMVVRSRQESEPAEFRNLYLDLHHYIEQRSLICPLFHPLVYCFAGANVEQVGLRNFFPSVRYDEIVVH